jgi:hypothetical protein
MEDLSREYFERNFFLLREYMEQGKFKIAVNLISTIDSLSRIKYLPNGRIDFLTVDEIARNTVNTIMMVDQEESFKNHDE